MKISPFRDSIIYLVIISIYTYISLYFSMPFTAPVVNYHFHYFAACFLLLINAFIIYWVVKDYSKSIWTAFTISVLYLVMPVHTGAFLFNFQLQALAGETLFIMATACFLSNRINQSIALFFAAVFFNTQFIAIVPFLCFSKKFTIRQKAILLIQAIMVFIYVFPFFNGYGAYYLNNIKTLFYAVEILIVPFQMSLLNEAILVDGYYHWIVIGLMLALLLAAFVFAKKNTTLKSVMVAFLAVIFTTLIPFKPMPYSDGFVFYIGLGFYPGLFLIVLFLFFLLCKKYNYSKNVLIFLGVLTFYWGIGNVFYQQKVKTFAEFWNTSMSKMPYSFNFEEDVRLKYSRVLIETKQFSKAEIYLRQSADKFPKEIWYSMLMGIAAMENDPKKAERIYQELSSKRIPFIQPE